MISMARDIIFKGKRVNNIFDTQVIKMGERGNQ